jgi:hypothetical protein
MRIEKEGDVIVVHLFDPDTIKAWRKGLKQTTKLLERLRKDSEPAHAQLREYMKEVRADRVKAIREGKAKS